MKLMAGTLQCEIWMYQHWYTGDDSLTKQMAIICSGVGNFQYTMPTQSIMCFIVLTAQCGGIAYGIYRSLKEL